MSKGTQEEEKQKNPSIRWIDTDWNNQGCVCQIGNRVWYTEINDTGRFVSLSMSLDEWLQIPEDERRVHKEEDDGEQPRRKRFQRSRAAAKRLRRKSDTNRKRNSVRSRSR